MSRPPAIPETGDVPPKTAAAAMGMTEQDLGEKLADLIARGFPGPDPTTGRYCIEAIHRWRRLRYPQCFPELTAAPGAKHAGAVFNERRRAIFGVG